jgi:hypothetical protein
MTTKAYFSMAALAGAATFAKQQGVPRAREAFSFAVSPEIFEPAAFCAMFIVGLLLICSTPRPSGTKSLVLFLHSGFFTFFSGVAGGVAG